MQRHAGYTLEYQCTYQTKNAPHPSLNPFQRSKTGNQTKFNFLSIYNTLVRFIDTGLCDQLQSSLCHQLWLSSITEPFLAYKLEWEVLPFPYT